MKKLTRREFLKGSTAGSIALTQLARDGQLPASSRGFADGSGGQRYNIYFGDLHNHNSVGYATGSLGRSFDIASDHLDFYAFTPHGWWHDIKDYTGDIEDKWLDGFDVTRDRWPDVIDMVRRYHEPGKFVAIPAWEWHSSGLGDYHVLFPDEERADYIRFDDLRRFQEFARERGALLIPHHPANRLGHRGTDIERLDPEVSPVMEIYSEWGNAEHDRAPYPYIRHTEGGRWTRNTFQHFLAQGHRLGVVASTDDHLGYPGAYHEGKAAVLAPELTREGIFDALRSRRTYGVTGDRILVDFRLNGNVMGSELPFTRDRELSASVAGWHQLDRVEVVKNGRVLHRDFPVDRVPDERGWDRPVLLRFEYGWGPWPALDMARTCDWDLDIEIDGGRLEDVHTCFQAGPHDEERRDRVVEASSGGLRLRSFTELKQQFEDHSQKAIVLKVKGGPGTRVKIRLREPREVTMSSSFAELAKSGEMLFTGEFPRESAMLHRLVFHERYETTFRVKDRGKGDGTDYYYLRAVQANNQLAWSSPIWVEPKA